MSEKDKPDIETIVEMLSKEEKAEAIYFRADSRSKASVQTVWGPFKHSIELALSVAFRKGIRRGYEYAKKEVNND